MNNSQTKVMKLFIHSLVAQGQYSDLYREAPDLIKEADVKRAVN